MTRRVLLNDAALQNVMKMEALRYNRCGMGKQGGRDIVSYTFNVSRTAWKYCIFEEEKKSHPTHHQKMKHCQCFHHWQYKEYVA